MYFRCIWRILSKSVIKQSFIPHVSRKNFHFSILLESQSGCINQKCRLHSKLEPFHCRYLCTNGSRDFDLLNSQINGELRKDQHSITLQDSFITCCDVSHLASNSPSEDRWFASSVVSEEESFLFGVLDGHGGDMCAHNVAQRLSHYVAAFLQLKDNFSNNKSSYITELLGNPKLGNPVIHDFTTDWLCQNSFHKLVTKINSQKDMTNQKITHGHDISHISKAIQEAFLQMDNDLHDEALVSLRDGNITDIVPYLTAVQSGCCALLCYLTKHSVFVANTGDCRAVAGVKRENGIVSAEPLSIDQTAANPEEVSRILSEHPEIEAHSLLSHGRLLGILAPLRAFGNAWLKWDIEKIESCFKLLYGPDASRLVPLFYDTPPYLTAKPAVTHYHLPQSGYRFLILATDGLWDLISNEEAVAVVEKYLRHGGSTNFVDSSGDGTKLNFDNAATALIRHALGGENKAKLTTMLSYTYPQVRMYRDDITVIVIVF